MHKIITPKDCSSNCFDSIIYSMLKHNNYDYEVYNFKYFYTDYYKPFSDDSIRIRRGNSGLSIINDIYCIDLNFTRRNGSINLFNIVCNSIRDTPVGILIDPYCCYWSPFYNKTHYSHYLLIVDIDYISKKYICFDVHFNTIGYIEVDFDIINNNFVEYFLIDLKNKNELKFELIIDKFYISITNMRNNLAINKSEMVNYLILSDKKILFPGSLETSSLLINLMWIAEDKRHFPIALRYIESKIEKTVFSSVYDLLSRSEHNFLLLKSILIKYAITGVIIEEQIKSVIADIFELDALTLEQMTSIFKGGIL